MSLHEGLISAIEKQPELFSNEDREDLLQQSSTWSEDTEELDRDIYQWLQTRPEIYNAALQAASTGGEARFIESKRKINELDSFNGQVQQDLGTAYLDRIEGERAQNIEQAIASYQSALTVYTESNSPAQWAEVQRNLGAAYLNRIKGSKAENIEQAIASYQSALRVYTESDFPAQWAKVQHDLGTAYRNRDQGSKAQNNEQAIASYQSALRVYTESDFPAQWAKVQHDLGTAYRNRDQDSKAENIRLAIRCYFSAAKILNDISNIFPMSIDVYLPPEVSQKALEFASEQITVEKAKQVFSNTIAICAVQIYLEAIQIETELKQANSWQAGQRTVFDLTDLIIPNYGRLECRPVEPNASMMALPSFTEPNCRGFVAVLLPESVRDSSTVTQIETVKLLGFIKKSAISEASESVPLSSLDSLENMLDDICLIESWSELSQQNDPVVKALQQVLGEGEEEFINRLEYFSQTEDIDDRNEKVVDYLCKNKMSSVLKNDDKAESSEIFMAPSKLVPLVEQLWDKLGI